MPSKENHDADNCCFVGLVEDENHGEQDKWDEEHTTPSGE
jgi:hypothetical protein